MSRSRKFFGWWGRMLVMPFARPVRDLRGSVSRIQDSLEKLNQAKVERAQAAGQLDKSFEGLDGRQRFERLAAAGGWTAQGLQIQVAAVRRARLGALAVGGGSFVVLLWLMAQLQGWLVLLLGVVSIMGVLGALLQAVRHAWWEFELAERTLLPLREFVRREDLLARVIRVRS